MSRLMKEKVESLYEFFNNDNFCLMLGLWAELYDQYKESEFHGATLPPQSLEDLQHALLNSAMCVSTSIEQFSFLTFGHRLRGFFEMLVVWEDEDRSPFSQKSTSETIGEPYPNE